MTEGADDIGKAVMARVKIEKVVVPPRGPLDSTFVIVGEAPGSKEIQERKPFVGPSGMVLDAALKQFPDGSYPEPYLTNTYRSRINAAEKDPAMLAKLAMECRPALLEEIKSRPVKPRIILALGNVALHALTGDTSLKITRRRGTLFPSELAEVGIMAATHPAFLLRGGGSFRQFKADVANAIFIAQGQEPKPWKEPTWSVIQSREELLALIETMKGLPDGSQVAKDLETTGFSFRMDRILCGGFTYDGNHVYVYNGYKTDALAANVGPNLIHDLGGLWDLDNIRYNWHNGKFDIKFLHYIGQEGARVDDDTMLMSYALEENGGIHDLETVAGDWINSPNWKGTLDAYKKKKQSYDVIPWQVLFKYMAFDIANTFRLKGVLRPLIANDIWSERLYTKTLIPASAFLTEVEKGGLFVDKIRVGQNHDAMTDEAAGYRKTLTDIADATSPGEFSDKLCNSPVQLVTLMFDRLGIKTKVRATGDDILEKLPPHPFVQTLRKYRKVHKSLSTYVLPYYKGWDDDGDVQDDGRVHTTYLLHGTATGRLSSRSPNVQNIPRDPVLRGQFISPPGRMYTEVDLNQAELRSLAQLSGDPILLDTYLNPSGGGLHEVTRAAMYGMKEEWDAVTVMRYKIKWYIPDTDPEMDPAKREHNDAKFILKRILAEQKMKAKNVNFGIIYGITSQGLAEQTGEEPREAQRWLDAWAKRFPVAWAFIEKCRMAPLKGQNLVTTFGHKKRFQIVTPETLVALQNEAANMPHQSTASTITMHGGIRTYKWLRQFDAFFVNTVHDSLLVEHPEDPMTAYRIQRHLKATLEQVPKDWGLKRLPFVADAEMTHRYGTKMDADKFFKEHGWDWEETAAKFEEMQIAA